MRIARRIARQIARQTIGRTIDWLETRWVTPAYSGWLLAGLALFFFAAATNTMAGWLYAISGVMLALLALAVRLPERMLRGLQVVRRPIAPVSAGEALTIELTIENHSRQPKSLIQVQDLLPAGLGAPAQTVIEFLPSLATWSWVYQQPTQQRGVYRWQELALRTAAPLGLFWCRRSQKVSAEAIVYPIVLPLSQCPLVDAMGQDINTQVLSSYQSHAATDGLTRTLRPYRLGDSIRLVHWRSSARYNELRVRELETYTGGQELLICLDSASWWQIDAFEQAVTAAASIYFYAQRRVQVSLWTAATGILRGEQPVLEALATTQFSEAMLAPPPDRPCLWLTQNAEQLQSLPNASRWLLWNSDRSDFSKMKMSQPGLVIQPDRPLEVQLQAPLPAAGLQNIT